MNVLETIDDMVKKLDKKIRKTGLKKRQREYQEFLIRVKAGLLTGIDLEQMEDDHRNRIRQAREKAIPLFHERDTLLMYKDTLRADQTAIDQITNKLNSV